MLQLYEKIIYIPRFMFNILDINVLFLFMDNAVLVRFERRKVLSLNECNVFISLRRVKMS